MYFIKRKQNNITKEFYFVRNIDFGIKEIDISIPMIYISVCHTQSIEDKHFHLVNCTAGSLCGYGLGTINLCATYMKGYDGSKIYRGYRRQGEREGAMRT